MSIIDVKLLTPRLLCVGASVIYSILMLSAIIYFEVSGRLVSYGNLQVLFAYLPAVFCSGFFGYRFAHWYEIIEGEPNVLEIICAPICVLFLSVSCASLCWGFSFLLFEKATTFHFWSHIFLAVSSSLVFLHVTWPILLVGGFTASLSINGLAKFLISR